MSAKLYVLTLVATQGKGQVVTAGASTILTLQESESTARDEAIKQVHIAFPDEDGWLEHQVSVFELPSLFETDGYQVAWQATKA